MGKNKYLRLFAITVAALMLLPILPGCKNVKKFDSPEAMISEVIGLYSGLEEHSSDRILIDGDRIIKYNIDNIFRPITEENFFQENFSGENWKTFDIDTLLSKSYIEITTEPISINIQESTISGLRVTQEGALFSQEGFLFVKIASDSIFPTIELQEKFEEYRKDLMEHEMSFIIAEAEDKLAKEQEALESTLSCAIPVASGPSKSFASAETIANCAFDSLKDYLTHPRTAKLHGYSESPLYDPYGRVCTLITVNGQNGFGNFILQDYYVVLQSCSYSGRYTYKSGGMHYSSGEDYLTILLTINDWDENPNNEAPKEAPYKEAIQLIKNGEYKLAEDKLGALGDYKWSVELKEACVNFSAAEKYKQATDLYVEGKYIEARRELYSLLKYWGSGYLSAERAIMICEATVGNAFSNNGNNT